MLVLSAQLPTKLKSVIRVPTDDLTKAFSAKLYASIAVYTGPNRILLQTRPEFDTHFPTSAVDFDKGDSLEIAAKRAAYDICGLDVCTSQMEAFSFASRVHDNQLHVYNLFRIQDFYGKINNKKVRSHYSSFYLPYKLTTIDNSLLFSIISSTEGGWS